MVGNILDDFELDGIKYRPLIVCCESRLEDSIKCAKERYGDCELVWIPIPDTPDGRICKVIK